MSDFLSSTRNEIAVRLRELRPLVEEYQQLEAAAAALANVPGQASTARRRSASAGTSPPRPTSRRARERGGSTAARRGRPRGTGARALQALELVRAQPGMTIADIATAMGIKQNYLYRVLPGLEKDGKVVKRDRGWHPADNGQPATMTVPAPARTTRARTTPAKRRAATRPRAKRRGRKQPSET